MAMFAANASTVYCRELLDFWLHEVSANGGTFPGAYCLSKRMAYSLSVAESRIREPLDSRRRQASDAFQAFLGTILFPSNDALRKILPALIARQ